MIEALPMQSSTEQPLSLSQGPLSGGDATFIETHLQTCGERPGAVQERSGEQVPLENTRLGDYRILKVLGQGGMGVVYEAEDVGLQRRVALKVMRPEVAAQALAKERFLREARLAARIEHDNVATIYHVGEERGVVFLAMPLLKGRALEVLLARAGRLPAVWVVRLGRQLALGLAAAHANGLIHRDIKPANLWVEPHDGGRVKILDFGLARGAEDVQLTQAGTILGTPAYMAPEQARGEPLDARCDLFSLGVVLYRMCTGELPFRGDTTMAVLSALAVEIPAPPRQKQPDLPAALSDVIVKLLAKSPTERFQSAQEVAAALDRVSAAPAANAPADVTEVVAAPARRVAPPGGRRRGRWLALALAALLLPVGYYFGGAILPFHQQPCVQVAARDAGKQAAEYALEFNGKDDIVSAPSPAWNGTDPLTLEAYVTPRADADATIVHLRAPGFVVLVIRKRTWHALAAPVEFGKAAAAAQRFELHQKTHLACVWTPQGVALYVNGRKQLGGGYLIQIPVLKQAEPFKIGADGPLAHPRNGFDGLVHEVRVSRGARYAGDFTPLARHESDQDTLALYRFDAGQGAVVPDLSGNGHHGQITGAQWVQIAPARKPAE